MSGRRDETGSDGVDCASTRAAIQQFVHDRGRFRDPATREHLKACTSCRSAYRAHVEGLAEIARAQLARSQRAVGRAAKSRSRPVVAQPVVVQSVRAQPVRAQEGNDRARRAESRADEEPDRSDEHRGVQDALEALRHAKSPQARRRLRARLILAPALLALGFLVVQRFLPGNGSASAQVFEAMPIVTPMSGNVLVGDRRLATDESALLARGASCRTAASSRARIVAGRAELELGPETYMQVEAKVPPRFRLALGEVHARGPCTITTVHGVAEVGVEGDLTIRLGWSGIVLEHGAGDVHWYDADGTHALSDGQVLELARALPRPDERDGDR